MPEETDGYVDDKISKEAFVKQINQIEDERAKMFLSRLSEFQKKEVGLYAFVFDSSDRIQHVFWENKVLDNKTTTIKISQEIQNYFIAKDKFLGEVLAKIDNNTLLLVASDHGFTSFEKAVSVNTLLVNNGLMIRSVPIGDSEDPLFQNVNWEKTKAYSLGFNSVYINLKNREPLGIVSEQEKLNVEQEIIDLLENLKDEKGNKVVNKVYRSSDVYSGEYLKNAPDLIIGFNPGFRMSWQTAVGGFSKEVVFPNEKKWVGDHLIDPEFVPGVLFSNTKFNINKTSQLNIAPTILDAFSIKVPQQMDGKSLLK